MSLKEMDLLWEEAKRKLKLKMLRSIETKSNEVVNRSQMCLEIFIKKMRSVDECFYNQCFY
jgi:hypothetical protein